MVKTSFAWIPSIHVFISKMSTYRNANNNAIDNAKWSNEQKREAVC